MTTLRPVRVLLMGVLVAGVVLAGCQTTAPVPEERPAAEDAMPARAFFVQTGMAYHQSDAERMRREVVAWWDALRTPPAPLQRYRSAPVRVVWQSPYYRVRIGPVATREEASTVRAVVQDRFDTASITRGPRDAP